MDIITKDLVNSILYDDSGNPSKFHDDILTGIKPYLKQNIQLGGGISIITESDNIDELFDESGILKEQYGGKGLVKYVKKFMAIRQFDSYFRRYTKFMNVIRPFIDNIGLLHIFVMNGAQSIQELLAEYYAYIKILVHLEYINNKKTTAYTTKYKTDNDKKSDPAQADAIIMMQYKENIKEFYLPFRIRSVDLNLFYNVHIIK